MINHLALHVAPSQAMEDARARPHFAPSKLAWAGVIWRLIEKAAAFFHLCFLRSYLICLRLR